MKKVREKKCKQCGEKFIPWNSLQNVCNGKCALEYSRKKTAEKKLKELKESLLTIGDLKKLARVVFQKWVRLRDINLPCISCGITNTTQWDGGHYFKAEIYSGLIFHEENCHKQCKQCNNQLHGNEANYRIGLVSRIGEERVKWLEENKDRLRTYKYSKDELIEIAKEYQLKIKQLNIKNHENGHL